MSERLWFSIEISGGYFGQSEPQVSIRSTKFFDQLSDYQLRKRAYDVLS
jgi:hypothetical protein